MDGKTGKLMRLSDEAMREFERESGRQAIPLTEEQADALESLGARKRKGYMRNQPCVCGSGQKFKRCCWGKYQ